MLLAWFGTQLSLPPMRHICLQSMSRRVIPELRNNHYALKDAQPSCASRGRLSTINDGFLLMMQYPADRLYFLLRGMHVAAGLDTPCSV